MRYGCGQDARDAHKMVMPRDFQDWLEFDDFKIILHTHFGRRSAPLKANVAPLLRCLISLVAMLFCGCYIAKMDGRCDLLHLITHLEKYIDLTSERFTLQSSKFASPRQSSVPMSSARPNLVLVRPPSLSSQHYNKWNQSLARRLFSLCVTLASLLTRSRTNMLASASICLM